MAEHLNQPKPDHRADPMNWMGHPIPVEARQHGFAHAKAIGLPAVEAHAVIEKMANALERDEPYKAQRVAMQYVDLTGYYRLAAALLAATSECRTRELEARRAEQEATQ